MPEEILEVSLGLDASDIDKGAQQFSKAFNEMGGAVQTMFRATDETQARFKKLSTQYVEQTKHVNELKDAIAQEAKAWRELNPDKNPLSFVPSNDLVEGLKNAQKETEELKKELNETAASMEKEAAAAAKAEEKARKLAEASDKAESSTGKLGDAADKSAVAMTVMSAAAMALMTQVVASVNAGVEAYNRSIAATNTLRNATDLMGVSFSNAKEHVDALSADGLLTDSQSSQAIANFLQMGMTVEQAADALDRLKDSAAYNRQTHYELGDAVVTATEGFRQELSTLSDAAGVPENIGKMYSIFAKEVGKSTDALTAQEKAMAVYHGIMRGTEGMVGNAAKVADEFTGAQARASAASRMLAEAYGKDMVPNLKAGQDIITSVIEGATGIITTFPGAASAITMFGTALAGIIALRSGVAALQIAIENLSAGKGLLAMFGGGWVAAGIAAFAAAATVIVTLRNNLAEALKKAEQANDQAVSALSNEVNSLKGLAKEYEALRSKTELTAQEKYRMLEIERKLVAEHGVSISGINAQGEAYANNTENIWARVEALEAELGAEKNIQTKRKNIEIGYDQNALDEARQKVQEFKDIQANYKIAEIFLAETQDVHKSGDLFYEAIDDTYDNIIKKIMSGDEEFQLQLADMAQRAGMSVEELLKSYVKEAVSIGEGLREFDIEGNPFENFFKLLNGENRFPDDELAAAISSSAQKVDEESEKLREAGLNAAQAFIDGLRKGKSEVAPEAEEFVLTAVSAIAKGFDDLDSLKQYIENVFGDILSDVDPFSGLTISEDMTNIKSEYEELAKIVASGIATVEQGARLDELSLLWNTTIDGLVSKFSTLAENVPGAAAAMQNLGESMKMDDAAGVLDASLESISGAMGIFKNQLDAGVISLEDYIAKLEERRTTAAMTIEEEAVLEKTLYDARVAYMEHEIAMGRMTLDEQIVFMQELLDNETMTYEKRMQLEEQLLDLKRSNVDETISNLDRQREAEEITFEEQMEQLAQLAVKYKENEQLQLSIQQAIQSAKQNQADKAALTELEKLTKAYKNGEKNILDYADSLKKLKENSNLSTKTVKEIDKAIDDLAGEFKKSNTPLKSFNDLVKRLTDEKSAIQAMGELGGQIQAISENKATLQYLKDLRDKVGESDEEYRKALDTFAQQMNVDVSGATDPLEMLQQVLDITEGDVVALVNEIIGIADADPNTSKISAKLSGIGVDASNAISWLKLLRDWLVSLENVKINTDGSADGIKDAPGTTTAGGGGGKRSSGGGGGGSKSGSGTKENTALKQALEDLEHKRSMDKLTAEQEIALLEEIMKKYAKTAEEKRDLEERIHDAKKTAYEDELSYIEHLLRMNKINEEQAQKRREAAKDKYKDDLTQEQRNDAEYEAYQRKIDKIHEDYEREMKEANDSRTLGNISLEEYIDYLKKMAEKYKDYADIVKEINEDILWSTEEKRQRDLQRTYDALDKKHQSGQLNSDKYIEELKRIAREEAKTEQEKEDARRRVNDAVENRRKQNLDNKYKDIDNLKGANKITLEQELAMVEEILQNHARTEEEKTEAADRARQLRLDIRQKEFDDEMDFINRKAQLNQINTIEEIRQLEQLREQYADNLEMYEKVTDQITAAYEKMANQLGTTIDRLLNGVIQAFCNKYQEMQKDEEDAIKGRIDRRKDETEAFVAEINKQIKALDELIAKENHEDKVSEYERKIRKLETQIAFEHDVDSDDYRQAVDQLARVRKEYDDYLLKYGRDQQKQALKDQITDRQDLDKQLNEADNAELEAVREKYKKLLDASNLRYEAEQVMLLAFTEGSMDEVMKIISDYAPEYDVLGESFGTRMAKAFGDGANPGTQQVLESLTTMINGAVDGWAGNLFNKITSAANAAVANANAMIQQANDAMMQSYQSKIQGDIQSSGYGSQSGTQVNIEKIENTVVQPMTTQYETEKALMKSSEQLAQSIISRT